ncbi:MAG: type IV toxin-antitoxin system AbiEi family antitoxin [Candidatus Micrarchaeota archaeon]
MYKQNISLGGKEVELLSTLEHDGKSVFSFVDALSILKGTNRQVVRNMLSRLVKKRRVERIKKGLYLLIPFKQKLWGQHEFAVVPFFAKEYYVSFWSALRFWNLTEQLPRKVFTAVKTPVKNRFFQNLEFQFITLSPRYFFGFTAIEVENTKVNVATKEKAILDCLLHPEYCGGIGEVAKAIKFYWKEIDWKEMKKHLAKMKNSAVERRLFYCLNFLKLKNTLKNLGKKEFSGFRLLDPSAAKKGHYVKKFGLQLNVDLSEELK